MAPVAPPRSGVKVRMYRQGHGDCFLLTFAGREGRRSRPVRVLIDCGLKNGSEVDAPMAETIADILEATGGHVDIAIVTHEHEDHVNGFARVANGRRLFADLTAGEVWLAWTEDAEDATANELRERFRDTLITLALAEARMHAHPALAPQAERLAELLETETGAEPGALRTALADAQAAHPQASPAAMADLAVAGITNKRAMAWLRGQAQQGVAFLDPAKPPRPLPHVDGAQVFALGPPRDTALLLDLDPRGSEKFDLLRRGLALDGPARSLLGALAPGTGGGDPAACPFAPRHRIDQQAVFDAGPDSSDAARHYHALYCAPDNEWRRIDGDWLEPAEGLALRLNNEVNNTSLVLAFRLPRTGKVLLFTGDAQRGNWLGWADLDWPTDTGRIDTRELLANCVLYKVGHHGSHNATLNGTAADPHANLGWMARGRAASDFVAMIPANTAWAMGKSRPWAHPMPEIEAALHHKAGGRVLRSDLTPPENPPEGADPRHWRRFRRRLRSHRLWFELTIEDS